jgi:Ser/Thr protein kinase RdoA (MazF antagonist)
MTDNVTMATALEPQVLAALAQYDLPEPESVELLTFSENAVFRADFPERPPVVVRLHSLGYHAPAEIESELLWIEALRRDGAVVTADVVRARDGSQVVTASHSPLVDRHAVVFEHLSGQEPGPESLIRDFRLLGHTTALMHRHAISWQIPASFQRFSWDVAGTLGRSGHWGDWRRGPNLGRSTRDVLERATSVVTQRLRVYGTDPLRFGLIHADLRLANLLVDESLVKVIDFDDCGFGWFTYDLATALTFMEDDPRVPELVSSWLDGYREVRSLEVADEEEIPTFLMLRRLVIFAWLGSRPGTELVANLGPEYARVTADLAEDFLSQRSHAWR